MESVKRPQKGIWQATPAKKWEEGYMLGNGKCGAILFGDPFQETLIGTHAEMFLPTKHQQPVPDLSDYLSTYRHEIKEKGYSTANKNYYEEAISRGYQGLTMSDPFVPAFQLNLSFHHKDIENYSRQLDYQTGETKTFYQSGGDQITQKAFVSHVDDRIVYHIENKDALLNLELFPEIFEVDGVTGNFSYHDHVFIWAFDFKYAEGGYTVRGEIHPSGGSVTYNGDGIKVQRTNEMTLIISIDMTSRKPGRPILEMNGYDHLFERHASKHQTMFDRVQLHLAKDLDPNGSFDQLLEQGKNHGQLSSTWVEKMYDAGRYMYMASAGHRTPNLQGIWSGDFSPAWSGDYTFDTNVQLSIAQALSGDLHEGLMGFFDLIESLLPDFRENARRYFGCDGIMSSIHSSTHGHHIHWNSEWPLHTWTCGAGWLAHWFYQYYRYTGDLIFLKERTVPILEEIVAFYRSFLIEGKDGYYSFSPSYSAENGCGDNATQDIAVFKEVLTNLINSYDILSIKSSEIDSLEEMMRKCPPYQINEAGALKEWLNEENEENYNHRHFSHLYPIFQSREFTRETEPALFQAARMAFLKRREAWLNNKSGETTSTHGRMHAALLATQFHMPEVIEEVILMTINNHCFFPSLMMSHYDNQDVFNVDGNGAFPQIVHDMLADFHHDTLYLLQALPKRLAKGELIGLKLPEQMTIPRLRWDLSEGNITFSLVSPIDKVIYLKVPLFEDHKQDKALANPSVLHLEAGKEINVQWRL